MLFRSLSARFVLTNVDKLQDSRHKLMNDHIDILMTSHHRHKLPQRWEVWRTCWHCRTTCNGTALRNCTESHQGDMGTRRSHTLRRPIRRVSKATINETDPLGRSRKTHQSQPHRNRTRLDNSAPRPAARATRPEYTRRHGRPGDPHKTRWIATLRGLESSRSCTSRRRPRTLLGCSGRQRTSFARPGTPLSRRRADFPGHTCLHCRLKARAHDSLWRRWLEHPLEAPCGGGKRRGRARRTCLSRNESSDCQRAFTKHKA
jgi:hypothetical protein